MHPNKAKVEPMSIKQKPDWIPPNPEPDRRYAPKVLTAMQYDLQRQLELGVVEESQSLIGAPVHMVRKEDSA